jgi:2-polyprenyl-6-methoxyphenol hydroxylase-like FAD-dependent oxidoreductase
MPQTAAFIDVARATFGADGVNDSIRRSMKGEATFWARENGHEVGTRDQRQGVIPALQLALPEKLMDKRRG